jgi:polysaccharide pyruvyl transferase WcaK-like protein
MMKNILFMHTGSANHGCEALVRTTSQVLGGPENVALWSLAKAEDERYGSAKTVERIVESEQLTRFSMPYFEALIRRKVFGQAAANMDVFLRETFKKSIAFSIGGDNYCYDWSAKQAIELDRKIRKYAKATVLWGCSIDPEAITPEMTEDLAGFDLITARESITYELLKPINPDTILVADTAFLLEKTELPLPENFIENNTVGINVSPLIMKYGTEENCILANYEELIRYILSETDMRVCLIPHVVWEYNDDRVPLQYLFEKFKDSGRVCMIDDGNCCELKGYIARCRFFVGARTHATIAAYSTGVPTLVVGYSVKSRGIARDLFGTEENYVLPVQNLKTNEDLTHAFRWLQSQENRIRDHLAVFMPQYTEKAKIGAEMVAKL